VVFWLLAAIGTAEIVGAVDRSRGTWATSTALVTAAVVLVAAGNLLMLPGRMQRSAQLQRFEEGLRKPAGLWLREHVPPGATVLLEPLGYIGYYAGPACDIRDEVGLVAPEMPPYRSRGPGWYGDAVADLRPDFLVQYTSALLHNRTEGTGVPLFRDEAQRSWLDSTYAPVQVFQDSVSAPWMEEKERSYVVLQRVSGR
jgi:hypothetical protein